MKLLMISGDRWLLQGKKSAFWYTLEELSKHWERIDVICPRAGKIENGKLLAGRSPPEADEGWKIENYFFPNVFFHPSPWNLLHQARWIHSKGKELIEAHHHDVMTVHEYPPFFHGLGAKKLHRSTGIPYVLEIHHVVGYPVAADIKERIGRWMSKKCLAWDASTAAAVRVVNAGTRDLLASFGVPESKIHVVPSFYLDAEVLRGELKEPRYDLVTCARLVPNKGIDALLRALALVPELTLVAVGDGPERGRLESLAKKLGLASRVTFLGWLPAQEDVVEVLRRSMTFVMPSKSEGGPRSALEAMAVGLPVISTRVGVMPDVIRDGENGLFTDGSPADIARKIGMLQSHPDVRERIEREAVKILDRFERKRLVAGYAEFLKAVSGKR